MAWYAELKRRKWYCINGIDMIRFYKQKLYDDWYNSLTDEQKQKLEEYRKEKEEKRKRESEQAIKNIMMMFQTVNELSHGRMEEWEELRKPLSKICKSKYW